MNHLTAAQTFFTQTMAQPHDPVNNLYGMGNDYAFVQAAVTSPNLLNELAETLDQFAAYAVDRDMTLVFGEEPFTYEQYFDRRILTPNDPTNANYAANVQDFMQRFPITNSALQAVTANFLGNVSQACARIVLDKTVIQNMFKDKYLLLELAGLKSIESTGSDFHKGGKQVLILTFSTSYWSPYPREGELKLVYKPSDVEADCLLVGNSAIATQVDPNLNITSSLTEIVNGLIAQERLNNPQSTLELLPTYRIQPRNRTSSHAGGYPLPVRDAYGYIEYLDYAETLGPSVRKYAGMFGISTRDYYPFGSSDFLIFPNQDEVPIVSKFYHQMGQLLALACTFSLQDLHLQNVRVRQYMPFLIDLEICLVNPVDNADKTGLFLPMGDAILGGIIGETINNEEFRWIVEHDNQKRQVYLEKYRPPKTFQNRLYAMRPQKKVVPPNAFYILSGYDRMMELLRTGVTNNAFNNWFARLNGVLVRYTPYGTTDFKRIRTTIFETPQSPTHYHYTLAAAVQEMLDTEFAQRVQSYRDEATPRPDFLVMQHAVSGSDYLNVDIPVFYHRIGTTDLVDSQGRMFPVPAQVMVNGGLQNTNINRNTFFAAAPTAANVQQAQLQILANLGTFNNRVALLQGTILAGLGLLEAPQNPGVLIP